MPRVNGVSRTIKRTAEACLLIQSTIIGMTFITVFAGGIAIQKTSWAIWFWQLGSCVLAVFFVYFLCPETGGRTLEEIDAVFMNKELREIVEHEHEHRRASEVSIKAESRQYVEKV